jgi:hypothetical protein
MHDSLVQSLLLDLLEWLPLPPTSPKAAIPSLRPPHSQPAFSSRPSKPASYFPWCGRRTETVAGIFSRSWKGRPCLVSHPSRPACTWDRFSG